MKKIIILSRMWDKEERGFETVERVATNMKSIVELIELGYDCDFHYKMTENYDDDFNSITIKDFIINRIDDVICSNNIGQYFLKVKKTLNGELLAKEEYRIQIRNLYED